MVDAVYKAKPIMARGLEAHASSIWSFQLWEASSELGLEVGKRRSWKDRSSKRQSWQREKAELEEREAVKRSASAGCIAKHTFLRFAQVP